jgi:hypothetical protein
LLNAKGILPFINIMQISSPIEEHLYAVFIASSNGKSNLHFTVSKHQSDFQEITKRL